MGYSNINSPEVKNLVMKIADVVYPYGWEVDDWESSDSGEGIIINFYGDQIRESDAGTIEARIEGFVNDDVYVDPFFASIQIGY